MVFRRFEAGLAWRTLLLLLSVWLLAEALSTPGLRAGRIVAALIMFAALANLWSFIRRTNFQVARFVESVRFEDYAQRFSDPSGGGFDVLGETLDRALKALQERHVRASGEARFLSAIVDDAPSALLVIDADDRVELLNKAARQLFGRLEIARRTDFEQLGPEFLAAISLPAGSRKITRILIDGVPQRVVLASAHVARLEGSVTVLSLLPVQSELGALEVAAQADLVRVLTHEIMNSLTPVTSLARSGAEMVAQAEAEGADLADARIATETVARRAEGILRFVESYREFARAPEVHRQEVLVKPWAREILQLAVTSAAAPIDALLNVQPETLRMQADPELLAQALLNLLRNSVRAVSASDQPLVRLDISRERDGRTRIEVRDNGPGIPMDKRDDIFLPFYTTHRGGSGVGLSFARQVVLAHGGAVSAGDAPEGGAAVTMVI